MIRSAGSSTAINRLAGWLAAAVAACLICASTASATVSVSDGFELALLSGQFEFLDDEAGRLDFADVLAAPGFVRLPGPLGRGYTPAASWLRLEVENRTGSEQSPVLRLAPQMLDHVDVYVQQAGTSDDAGHYRHYALGDHVPVAERQQSYPVMGVPVILPPGAARRIYVRVQTTSSHLLGAELVSGERYVHDVMNTLIWTGSYQALAFGLALIAFLQAARLRDLTHGLYGLLPLGLCLNSIGTEGMTPALLPDIAHSINDGLVGASVLLSFGGLGLFAMRLFQTARYHPWGHRYLQAVALLAVAACLASGTAWYGRFAAPLMTMGVGLVLFLTWAAWKMIDRGEKRLGRLFIAAFTLPLLGAAISMTRYLGWLPQTGFTQYILPASSLLHMLMMNLALTERLLEAEATFREAAQKASLDGRHRRDLEQLLGMLGHEIRTPVAVIDAATQSLQALDPAPAPERSQRYERINRAVRRLGVLFDLVVAQGRSDVADWQPVRSTIAPASLCNEAVGLLDSPLALRIHTALHAPLPDIQGDSRMLRFMLLNLLDNACSYSPPDAPVRLSVATEGAGVAWRIEDTGPGIPPGMEERIFEKYVRAGEAGDKKGKAGLGLGLYLARHIAEAHGGWLRALPGQAVGACFVCWLPAQRAGKGSS